MSSSGFVKTFDRYTDDAAPPAGTPAARGVWALRVTKFDAGAKIGSSQDGLRTLRALGHYRRKPGKGVEPFEVYISGNISFEYVTDPAEYDIFDGALSPQSSTDIGANQVVVGPDAPGIVPTGNPILIGGADTSTGAVRRVSTDTVGRIFARLLNANGTEAIITPGAAQAAAAMQTKPINADRPSYAAAFTLFLSATTAALLALEAGASKTTRLRRMRLWLNTATQTTGGPVVLALGKTTAASTGGAALTPIVIDGNDAAFSGTVRNNNGALTTTPAGPSAPYLAICAAFIPAAVANVPLLIADWIFDGLLYKSATILPGVANGLSLGQLSAAAGAAGQLLVECFLTEE